MLSTSVPPAGLPSPVSRRPSSPNRFRYRMAEALQSAPPTASKSRRVSPLRLRLLALVAIAFFPLVLLVVRLANDERHATTLRERDASLRLLDVAIAEHRDLTRTALELL